LSIFLLKIFFPFYIDTILLRIQILFDFIFNIFNYQIPITQPGYHTFSLRGDQYESIYKQLEDLIFYTNKYVDKYYVLKNLFILIFLGQNYNFDNNDIGYLNILSNHGVFFILIVFFLYCYFSYLFFSMKKTLKKSYTFFIENLSLFYFFLGVIIINFFTKIYLIVPINYILFLFIGLTLRNAQKLKHYVNFT
jgi:hypothetical protein